MTDQRRGLTEVEMANCNSEEEMIFAQWKSCIGLQISRYAMESYVLVLDDLHCPLCDVRLWGPQQFQPAFNNEKIRLEFHFDGIFRYDDEKVVENIKQQLNKMLKQNLNDGIKEEFKEKLLERKKEAEKRLSQMSGKSDPKKTDRDSELTTMERISTATAEEEWQTFINRPAPAIEVEIEGFRIDGTVTSLTCVRCTMGIAASRILGQQGFPENFEGSPKKYLVEGELPKWVHAMTAFGVFLFFWIAFAWYQGLSRV